MSVAKPTSYRITPARRVHRNVAVTESLVVAQNDLDTVKAQWATTTQPFFGLVWYSGAYLSDNDIGFVSRLLDTNTGKQSIKVGIARARLPPNPAVFLWTQRHIFGGLDGFEGYRCTERSAGSDATYFYWFLTLIDTTGTAVDWPAAPASPTLGFDVLFISRG